MITAFIMKELKRISEMKFIADHKEIVDPRETDKRPTAVQQATADKLFECVSPYCRVGA